MTTNLEDNTNMSFIDLVEGDINTYGEEMMTTDIDNNTNMSFIDLIEGGSHV